MTYKCESCPKIFPSSQGRSNHERRCVAINRVKLVLKHQAIRKAQRQRLAGIPLGQSTRDVQTSDETARVVGEGAEIISMDVDATTSVRPSIDDFNLPPTRVGRKRRPPKRFRDEPPPPTPNIPVPVILNPETLSVGPPPPPIQHLDTASTQEVSNFKTHSNNYGVYRMYPGGRPSIYPRTQAAVQMFVSPNFEAVQTETKRPWWAVFGKSLKSVIENLYSPFANATTYLLMYWQNSGQDSKSNPEIDRLAAILQDPRFNTNDLSGFKADRESRRLDAFADSHISTNSFFNTVDGWIEDSVAIPLPCEGRKQQEKLAPAFNVSGLFYRRPIDVIKAALRHPTDVYMHWFPFEEYWKPSEGSPAERIYSELYNSDAFIDEHRRLIIFMSNASGPRPRMETVIVGIMLWSDSTHLASFGTASLWPIYMFIGNQSKYIRSKTSMLIAQHLAYIPKLSNTFQDFYKQVFGVAATEDVITHCKRELIHLIWLLILDEDFMHAYVHGFDYVFHDGIRRLVFPRLFTYAADYPEKVLLACIKYLARCPCPRCLVLKNDISDIGKKKDMAIRSKSARVDDLSTQLAIDAVRRAIFDHGMSFSSQGVANATWDKSTTGIRSAFSTRFHEHGFNHYEMFVPDLLHEFELGVWKATFTHLMRILYANGNDGIQELNKRYRQVPTFGRGTIRRFGSNASAMKKLAARDYEDLLQCAIPVFEGLLPQPHNRIVLTLLYELATWHGLAKLRLHTESTLKSLDEAGRRLGHLLREFKKTTCFAYVTKELPSEEAARGRREAALRANLPASSRTETQRASAPGKREKKFNLSTYKLHALGDYPAAIRMFGTTDGYTSQVGETQHKKVKHYYRRASKSQPTRSITKLQQREQILRDIAERERALNTNTVDPDITTSSESNQPKKGKRKVGKGPMLLFEDEEKLPFTDPSIHYQVGNSRRYKLNIYQWPDEDLEQDIAYKNWYPKLLDHLLARINGIELFDGDEHTFSDAERASIVLDNDAVYQHKVLRVNYTTYDLRRDQDSINPRTNADIMMAAHEDDTGESAHPYWYARVIGIFHTFLLQRGDDCTPRRMDFLWVRWYGRDLDHRAGWKTRRLHRVGFVSSTDLAGYGFLDPALVIRSVHLIPAFELGRTTAYLTSPVTRPAVLTDSEWRQFYINPFVDRDMFMRFRGGGVGHKSTREATDVFLQDRHPSEATATTGDEDMEENEEVMIETSETSDDEGDDDDEGEQDAPETKDDEDALGPEDGEDQDDDDDIGYGAL